MNNYSLAVFLVNPNVRCVTVSYDKAIDRNGKVTPSDVKSFKTLDASIAKDDFVCIPTDTRWGYTVGKVVNVDIRVNFSSPEIMRWVVARVDKTGYEDFCAQEAKITERVADAEEASLREELKTKLMAANPDFSGLSLADMTAPHNPPRAGTPVRHGGAQAAAVPGETRPFKRPPSDDDIPF